jgi:hypothetical protein
VQVALLLLTRPYWLARQAVALYALVGEQVAPVGLAELLVEPDALVGLTISMVVRTLPAKMLLRGLQHSLLAQAWASSWLWDEAYLFWGQPSEIWLVLEVASDTQTFALRA